MIRQPTRSAALISSLSRRAEGRSASSNEKLSGLGTTVYCPDGGVVKNVLMTNDAATPTAAAIPVRSTALAPTPGTSATINATVTAAVAGFLSVATSTITS